MDFRFRGSGETASPPGESAFGRWNFDPSYTRNPASPGGTGDAIATMLLGFPIALRRDVFLPGSAYLHTNELNFYVKDDWRITSKLTINLGLHYEINTPFREVDNKWANFDPARARVLIADQSGVSPTANVMTDYKAIGPRVAFAWQATAKTVIRGGYGIFYDPQGNQGTSIRQFRQPPFDFVLNIPQSGNDVPALSTATGMPIVTTSPDLTQGTAAIYALRGITPDFRNSQVQQFNFSAQRELSRDTVLTVGFVGSFRKATGSRAFRPLQLDVVAFVGQLVRGRWFARPHAAESEKPSRGLVKFRKRPAASRQHRRHLPVAVWPRQALCQRKKRRELSVARLGDRRHRGHAKRTSIYGFVLRVTLEHRRGHQGQPRTRSGPISAAPDHRTVVQPRCLHDASCIHVRHVGAKYAERSGAV